MSVEIVSGFGYNNDITKKKEVARMANLYTIEDLLIGKTYRSKSLEGKIVSAEKHSAWFGRNAEGYLVEIDTGMIKNEFRVVAVGEID